MRRDEPKMNWRKDNPTNRTTLFSSRLNKDESKIY